MLAIVSGSTRGVGYAVAEFLASKGFNLVLVAKDENRLLSVQKQFQETYRVQVSTISLDFSDPITPSKMDEVFAALPTPDIIVNNLGSFEMGDVMQMDYHAVQRLMNINFFSAIHLTQPFLEGLKNRKSGFIFNVGSIVTEQPRKDVAAYTISKFALQGYTKVLYDELKYYNVKVTEIIPGSINTSSWDGIDAPKDLFVQPSDIVAVIDTCINASSNSGIEQIIIRPTNRDF